MGIDGKVVLFPYFQHGKMIRVNNDLGQPRSSYIQRKRASRSRKEGCTVLGEENVGRGRQKGRKELVAQLYPALCDSMDCSLPGSSIHGDSPGKNTGVGCHFLLQRIFQTQGSNPGLLHCRQILYHLSHQGSRGRKMQ